MDRKRLIDLTPADLLENEVWEFYMADNIEYVSASDKIIRKGETVYGIISFQGTGYDPVSIKLKN